MARLDVATVHALLNDHKVTLTTGVSTVWMARLAHLETIGGRLARLKRIVIGGSACPRAMVDRFRHEYGVDVMHAWGMTEMSPLGSSCRLMPEHGGFGRVAQHHVLAKQGQPPFTVEMKITENAGRELRLRRRKVRPAKGARPLHHAGLFRRPHAGG